MTTKNNAMSWPRVIWHASTTGLFLAVVIGVLVFAWVEINEYASNFIHAVNGMFVFLVVAAFVVAASIVLGITIWERIQ